MFDTSIKSLNSDDEGREVENNQGQSNVQPKPQPEFTNPLPGGGGKVVRDPSSPPPYENASVPELLVGMYNSCDDPYLLVGDQDTPRGVEFLYEPPPPPAWPVRVGRINIIQDLMADIKLRKEYYLDDWTVGFSNKRKIIPAILFLYFACLSPAISFGTIANQITNGAMGNVEFLLACGLGGMAYSVLSGQPMAFIAPTGLTLAFISSLYSFCTVYNIPFLPTYTCVGLWTSGFMMLVSITGAANLIKYCTKFTDDVFNALLSFNFIYEAVNSLKRNFVLAGRDKSTAFVSAALAGGSFMGTDKVSKFNKSKYFTPKIRNFVRDFGPVVVIVTLTIINQLDFVRKFNVKTLNVPKVFQLSGGRKLFVGLAGLSTTMRWLCAIPALLLTGLFYFDQNISVRVVNSEENKLKKGGAYSLDMFALSIITASLSLCGLPWMCGATVQSMANTKALSEIRYDPEEGKEVVEKVVETRLTGMIVHAMVAGSLLLLPTLGLIPVPIVSGVFLYLGKKLGSGNSFVSRIGDQLSEKKRLPKDHPIFTMGRPRMGVYTGIQLACFCTLWMVKQNQKISILFPSVIAFLMGLRTFYLPKIFTPYELNALGDVQPQIVRKKISEKRIYNLRARRVGERVQGEGLFSRKEKKRPRRAFV